MTRTGSFNAVLLGAAAVVVLGALLLALGMVIAGRQSSAGSAFASPKAS